jgi:tRNA-specific 2-thiouridylase
MAVPSHILSQVRETMGLAGDPASHRVVVAMSGGVDSSVVAGLLSAAGYGVVGITLQLYDHGAATGRRGTCCAGRDIHDARRVASALGIAHYVLDFESRFREAVIDAFADSYLSGETPVPCIACNRTVKFADLLERARALGASALATGHYIQSAARRGDGARRDLLTPADTARDQSYFLYATRQDQVDFLRFPLGSLTKAEARELARDMGLEVAAKPDSQDICFVPEGRYQDVVRKLRPEADRPGDVVHVDGRRLGRHDGVINFTVGQRKGLGIAGGEALYVVRVDARDASIIVGPRDALSSTRILLKDLNWLGDAPIRAGEEISLFARIRSSRPPVAGRLALAGEGAEVRLEAPETAVSPGQACVFYERPGPGARVLGGGTIILGREVPGRVAVQVDPVVNRLESEPSITI